MESVYLKAIFIIPNWIHLEPNNLQNFPSKNCMIYIHLLCLLLLWFSFLFYSIREMSVVPHCMKEQKLLIFSTVHLCSIRYLPRLWHSIAESQPELEQRFVWSILLPLTVLKWQRTRAVQTQPSRVLQTATLNTAGWSFDWLVLLCLMQPRVGFDLWAARAHALLTQTEPAAAPLCVPQFKKDVKVHECIQRRAKKVVKGTGRNVLCGGPVTFGLVCFGERTLVGNLIAVCSNLRRGSREGDAELFSLDSSGGWMGTIQSCAKKGLDWTSWNISLSTRTSNSGKGFLERWLIFQSC